MSNGYSRAAAAGIAGTIAGESAGNPESVGSGGAGLIGWTPPSSAYPNKNIVTGNAQADFNAQLQDLLAYANNNSAEAVNRGGVNLQTLKSATDPVQAASWWSAFEGPLVPGSDIRTGVAQQIYSSLNGYQPNSGYTQPGGSSTPANTQGFNLLNPGSWVPSIIQSVEKPFAELLERGALIVFGAVLIVIGIMRLSSNKQKQQIKNYVNTPGSKNTGSKVSEAAESAGAEASEAAEVAAVA